MHHLGYTRSVRRSDHLLLTPDTFIRAPLPGMQKATAIVHASPAVGAAFVQYTLECEPDGRLAATTDQRFLYVLDGTISVGAKTLGVGDFAYIGPGDSSPIVASSAARAEVIEKPYQPLAGRQAPASFTGREADVTPTYLGGDLWLGVRALLPDDAAFDFRVNTMSYHPGATLPMVEVHVMEHGLLMLSGAGIYRLGDSWYPVDAGDFIWMAPYCPQWFGALGKTPAKYLLYKDWDRHPGATR